MPETGRVIAMFKIYCRSVGGHIGCPFFFSLFLSMISKGQTALIGRGSRTGIGKRF